MPTPSEALNTGYLNKQHMRSIGNDDLQRPQQKFFGNTTGLPRSASSQRVHSIVPADFKRDAMNLIASRLTRKIKDAFTQIRMFAAFKETQQLMGRNYDSQVNISMAFERYKKHMNERSKDFNPADASGAQKENNSRLLNILGSPSDIMGEDSIHPSNADSNTHDICIIRQD